MATIFKVFKIAKAIMNLRKSADAILYANKMG